MATRQIWHQLGFSDFKSAVECALACVWPEARPEKRREEIYFAVSVEGPIKIGCSWDAYLRTSSLNAPGKVAQLEAKTGLRFSDHRLCTVIRGAAFSDEKHLHHLLRAERVGSEWFRGPLTERLIGLVASHREAKIVWWDGRGANNRRAA